MQDPTYPLILERYGLRPPGPDALPASLEAARFWRHVERGASDACWPGPVGHLQIAGRKRQPRAIAWCLAHGAWPEEALTVTCGTPSCCNADHMTPVHRRPVRGDLPPEEVAHFLGIEEAELRRLCRRILGRQPINPASLDLLVAAITEAGGVLP